MFYFGKTVKSRQAPSLPVKPATSFGKLAVSTASLQAGKDLADPGQRHLGISKLAL